MNSPTAQHWFQSAEKGKAVSPSALMTQYNKTPCGALAIANRERTTDA